MLFNMKTSALGVVILAMAPSTYAHMILAKPVPFGQPTNSPLSPDGSNYPCQVTDFTVKQLNEWAVGSQQPIEWSGSAVHGGGSGQLAVTMDNPPTKDSKFKVIHSFEGGFPLSAFQIEIPKELPNADSASVVVTWFNKIGNREIYANCAPVKITGGSDDKAAFEKLPDLALANIAVGSGANCKTPESSDYTFENPGEYVTRTGSGPFVPLCGGAPVGGAPGQPSGQPAPNNPPAQSPNNGMYTASASAPAPSAPASQAPAPSAPASQAPNDSAPGAATSTVHTMVIVTGAPSSPSKPAAQPSQAPAASTPAAPAPSAPAAQPSGAPATPGGGPGTCTTDGEIVCNGEDQFGLCDHGKVVFMPVAAGTKCQGGNIAKRAYTHRAQRLAV